MGVTPLVWLKWVFYDLKPFQSVADWGSWQLHIRARRQTHKPYKGKAKYLSLLHKRLLEGNFFMFSNVLFIGILLSFNSYQCQGFEFFIQNLFLTEIDCILGKYENTVPSCFWSHWSNCEHCCNPQRDTSWCSIYCYPKWHPTEDFLVILEHARLGSYLRTTIRNEGMYIWII